MEVVTKKALINAQLMCAFVFAYKRICKSRFSYYGMQNSKFYSKIGLVSLIKSDG